MVLRQRPHDGDDRRPGRDNSKFGSPQGLWGPAATTLEYASADSAISRVAARSCRSGIYERAAERSGYWRNLLDPADGRIEPRLRSGDFHEVPADSRDGFVEGSSAQYTWMVPHDPAGLADALGGRGETLDKLNSFFSELNTGQDSAHAFLGNEPNLNAPWLYDWYGRPDRTQEIVRQAQLELYGPGPGGYPGNDDLGTMSSWWVLASLGLYPAIPGEDILALGSPLFPRTTVDLPGGKLRIVANGAAPARPYVAGLDLDGRSERAPWLRFRRIRDGGTMRFSLAGSRSDWGSGHRLAPPSFGPDRPLPASC